MRTGILQCLAWLTAVALAAAALMLGAAPADPARGPLPAVREPPRLAVSTVRTGGAGTILTLAPTRGIFALAGIPLRVAGCIDTGEAMSAALVHRLDELVYLEQPGTSPPQWWCIFPAGELQAAYGRAPFGWLPMGPKVYWYPGFGRATGNESDLANLEMLLASYQRTLGSVAPRPLDPQPESRDDRFMQFHPTHRLIPLADDGFQQLVADFLHEAFNLHATPVSGGLALQGDRSDHAHLQSILAHTGFAQLARDLSQGSDARRTLACRAALADDEPLLAQFALRVSAAGRTAGLLLDRFPDELLASMPEWKEEFLVRHLLGELPAAVAVRAVERLCEVKRKRALENTLMAALGCQTAAVRRRAMDLILERLPQDVLKRFESEPVGAWPYAEREWFCNALVDRLRSELREGNARRATSIVHAMLAEWTIVPFRSRAKSRLLELGAMLFMDEQHGHEFRRGPGGLIAAREVLHDSRPEARQMACGFLIALDSRGPLDLLLPLVGDPYTQEFVAPSWPPLVNP